MRLRGAHPRAHSAIAAALLALTAAGCGTEGEPGRTTVTVYSSLPLQGASRALYLSMVNGIELAVKQAGEQAGSVRVRYVSLDDSTAQAASWTPEGASANARRAAQDESAIAYIGEGNSGASAISIPILNEAGLLQVAGSNTAVGLTTREPGATPGEPEKYYPTGARHYVRLVPRDTVQSKALVSLMTADGCTRLALANDKEVYGSGLARNVALAARASGLEVVADTAIDPKSPNYRSLAANIRAGAADCFLFAGITANNAVQLYKDVGAALPGARLYAPDGLAETKFTDDAAGGLPATIAERIQVTVAALAPQEYPPEGQRFFADYRAEYGTQPESYAIYAYECMRLILDSIAKTGGRPDRDAVRRAALATRNRHSVLGTYSIDANGDTTLTDYGVYTIRRGALTFSRTLKAR
jgi:branched-chain amino acid transport system substrate-binding protein